MKTKIWKSEKSRTILKTKIWESKIEFVPQNRNFKKTNPSTIFFFKMPTFFFFHRQKYFVFKISSKNYFEHSFMSILHFCAFAAKCWIWIFDLGFASRFSDFQNFKLVFLISRWVFNIFYADWCKRFGLQRVTFPFLDFQTDFWLLRNSILVLESVTHIHTNTHIIIYNNKISTGWGFMWSVLYILNNNLNEFWVLWTKIHAKRAIYYK